MDNLAIVKSVLYKAKHKIFKKAAENQKIKLACSTFEKIAYDHQDKIHLQAIVQATQQQKSFFTSNNIKWHYKYFF